MTTDKQAIRAQIETAVEGLTDVPAFVVLDHAGDEIGRWGEADTDPLADIQHWIDEMNSSTHAGYSPTTLIMPERSWRLIETKYARHEMSRRAFRRWRAKRRVYWRDLRTEPDLPEGVWEQAGRLVYACLSCGQTVPLECDPEEFDPEVAYCGGSPRCLP